MGKNYIGNTVLVETEQIINESPEKVLTLDENNNITVSDRGNVGRDYVETVTGDLVDNTDVRNPILNEKKELPLNFLIMGTYDPALIPSGGRYVKYLTDEYRTIDLYDAIPQIEEGSHVVQVVNNIQRRDSDIIFEGRLDSATGNRFVAVLYNFRLVDNKYIFDSSSFQEILGINLDFNGNTAVAHGSYCDGNFVYFMTRPNSTTSTIATQVYKVNVDNPSDYRVLSLPTTVGYYSLATKIELYKNKIFMLMTERTAPNVGKGYMIAIDKDLKSQEIVFTINNPNTSLLRLATFWLMYKGEFIIPTVNNVGQPDMGNTLGIQVYDYAGTLKREVTGLVINNTATGQPAIHWGAIMDNKAILVASSSTASNAQRIIRIDIGYGKTGDTDYIAPTLEESVPLPHQVTNDNTLFTDGTLYLNSEASGGALYKYYYKNLSTYTEEINPYWALASLNPISDKEELKTKLSQFKNDLSPSVTNLTYTASPTQGQVNSDTGTDAVLTLADTTNAGLLSPADKTKLNNTPADTNASLAGKQATLVSGTNIKTVNGNSILGSGDVTISGGATNLTYTASATNGIVVSDTGTDAIIPLVDTTNAGLMSPSDKTKINNVPADTTTALAGKQATLSGVGYPRFNGTTISWVTGSSNAVVLGDGSVQSKNALVSGGLVTPVTLTNSPIADSESVSVMMGKLQAQINAGGIDNNLSKTANYTILSTDYGKNGMCTVYVDATAGAVTITLEAASTMAGKTVHVIKTDASANSVTVKGNGTTNINMSNTYLLGSQYERTNIKSNGTQYYIF